MNKKPTVDIPTYHSSLEKSDKVICDLLRSEIEKHLPTAESKVWHGAPVWFINDNPIVGYDKLKDNVRLLFWSGQSFDEPGLKPEGSYKAAEARFNSVEEVDTNELAKWLKKAEEIQWDYKNIVKRKGELVRL